MERDIWLMMVNQSGKGLYKKGHLGREVHEFEIEAALEAQRVFAEMTNTEKIQITCMEFSTPPAGSTYRTITEPIHHRITAAPTHMETAWMNVWHSVAEASFLISVGTPKVMSFIDGAEGTGLAAYLAYCRECRDWVPTPRMFSELSAELQSVWQEVEVIAAKIMSAGFRKLDYYSSQTEH